MSNSHRTSTSGLSGAGSRGPPIARGDLALLRAMVALPNATDGELAKLLGLSRPAVTRTRMRLRREGIAQVRYMVDLDRVHRGGAAVACGLLSSAAAGTEAAAALSRAMAHAGVSGAFLVEGIAFCGILLPKSLERLPAWSASVLSARHGHTGLPVFASLETHPFVPGEGVRRVAADFNGLMSQIGSKDPAAREPAKSRPPRSLRRTEFVVARELILDPEGSVAQGAKAAGTSRSTFAHVKSKLLADGLLTRAVWVNLPRIGYPYLLVQAKYRRPAPESLQAARPSPPEPREPATIARFVSPTNEFTAIAERDLKAVGDAVKRLNVRDREEELLVPPFVAVFSLPSAHVVSHLEPDDLAGEWFSPLG